MPVHDLAYLLANLNDAAELWRRCKASLYRLVPTNRERCIASNINTHVDIEETGWLVERVHREDDHLGPYALRALIKLDPDLAVQHLDRLQHHLLYFTRHWCFQALLAKRPEATYARIADMLRSSADPYALARVFSGEENSLTVDILDVLLDCLDSILQKELSEPGPPNQCPPYGAFLMLSRVSHPDLLARMRHRAGTALEEKLTAWLLGERPLVAVREGIEVLYKFGGIGFTRVINGYLRSTTSHDRYRGLELAMKRPDDDTIALLRDISLRDELSGGHIVERGLAMATLVYLGKWHEVILAVIRWGVQIPMNVLLECADRGANDDAFIALALEASERTDPVDAGRVMALGLARCADQAAKIRTTFRDATPDSELAQACVISLALLRDSSPETVELLIAQLNADQHLYWVRMGLLQLNSARALDALVAKLRAKFDVVLTIDLLRNPYSAPRAAEIIRTRLRDAPAHELDDMLTPLGRLADEFLAPLVNDVWIRDYLREMSYADEGPAWVVGSKAVAIRGLSKFDRHAAFLAARKALQNSRSHDRPLYPSLLVELDASRALDVLLEQAIVEKDPHTFHSIGRALSSQELSAPLLQWTTSEEVNRRLAACRLAAVIAHNSGAISDTLRKLVDDPDDGVARAARDALRKQRDARATSSLLAAVLAEESHAVRWIFLDALLELGDPDGEDQSWPAWAKAAASGRPFLEREYIGKRITERRESMAQEFRKEREKSRK